MQTKNYLRKTLALVMAFLMVLTMVPVNLMAADRLEMAPAKGPVAVKDAAPPEDTDTTSDAKNAVHGYVGVQVGDDINKNLAKADKSQFIPKEGVKVYFQWFKKKGNRVSPVYAATSDATGQFHMKVKPYIADDGKLVKFDADTSISAGFESYKFWVDESTIPEGYQLQYSTGESVEFNDAGVAGANNYVIPNKLTDFKVLLMEIPKEDLMHKTATPTGPQIFADPVGNVGQGAVRGKVSWDYESAGGIQWGIVATHTSPAPDVTVRASYLSDYALKQIFSADTANMLSVGGPGQIRGKGWTFALEKQLQDWIKEKVKAEPDLWIAETVSDVTNAKGEYKIQFKGTWGPERNGVNVANYTAPKGWTQEQKDRLGTVAKNATDGSFLTGALDKNEKHVNSDWLFISTEGTDKLRVMTPWNNNWYTGSNNAWGIHDGWAQAAFGVSTVQAANSTRADFAFAPAEIKFNITNYDTGFNTATPGDVAETETKGLPYSHTSDSFRIVWYDAKGNVVKTENAAKPTATGDFPVATYDTKDVTETTTFTAKLYRVDSKGNNGQLLAQDSFTVKISKLVVSAHDEVSIANPGANDESMKGATYSAEGLPEGLTIDPNNGTISGKATTQGKYTVTVKTTVPDKDSGENAEGISQYVALVTDSPLKDGAVNSAYSETVKPTEVDGYVFKNVTAKFITGKEIAGLTIADDQISETPTAKVEATEEDPNVEVTYDIYKLNDKGQEVLIKKGHVDKVPLSIKDGQSAKYEPEYTAVDGTVGTPATVAAPTFKDADGQAATPQNVTYELGEGAPTGAAVNADGSVSYTPVEADADKAVEIPVVVKYSDGSTDNVNAVINVSKNAKTADKVKELGGLNPQTIKVWKDDKFAWKDGVVPATTDTNNLKAVWALLEEATITDKQNPARDSSTAGKHEGTLIVTFNDGSSIEVPKQMLIVSDPVVVIDPNDPNPPKKDDLPGDKITVIFKAGEGIVNINTNGKTTYAKPNARLADTDFPTNITYKDEYKNEVTWTPTDQKVDTNNRKYYNAKTSVFMFKASATLKDIIDRTGNEDKPTPKGYVRVTFTNGDGVNDIENNKVYDVKSGTALPADKYPAVTAKDGYENPVWSTPAGTAITAANATITATATATTPTQKDADKYDPKAEAVEKDKGTAVTADDVTGAVTVPGYPTEGEQPKVTVDDPTSLPDGNTPGKTDVAVTVTYPDGSTDKLTVPVTIKDTTTPTQKDTKVTGDVNPVDPTNDPQDTGINVENPDKDTKITAKDEDENDIPVIIDNNGNVIVTPGTNVDGPITVTVEDPDLPGGKKDITVPVNGHKKGRDDNYSGYPYRPSYNYLTLTLDENYRGGEITHHEVLEGELIERYLYVPRRRGYVFEGWSYNSRRLDEVRPGYRIYYPTTLYAIWAKDRDYDRDEREEEPEDLRPVHDHNAYMFGYTDGTVRPNGKITRAEAAALVTRLLGLDTFASAAKPMFSDTPSSWYNKAINAAVQRGIMKGYPDGRFRPNAPITRAEFTQMISTIDNKPYGVAPFADVKGHWAERPIGSEYQAGRIMGYPDQTFRPNAFITRCEAVVILNKMFERNYDAMSLKDAKNAYLIKGFFDLPTSFWGYYDMIEATNSHSFKRRVQGKVQEDWTLVK